MAIDKGHRFGIDFDDAYPQGRQSPGAAAGGRDHG
jgi:hypothetical protein